MRDLPHWTKRPLEEAALMNPAFVALLLHSAVRGYESEAGKGMPFALAFLVPPLVLVEPTRIVLPSRRDTSLAAWIQEHSEIRLRFASHTESLVPATREGLIYGTISNALAITRGLITTWPLRRGAATAITSNTEDFQNILKKSTFVGKWLFHSGSTETTFALWGIRP